MISFFKTSHTTLKKAPWPKMSKILITTSSFDTEAPEIKNLEAAGFQIVTNPHKRRLTEDEVAELLTPDIIGIIAGLEPLTASVIEGAAGLKVISRCGAGLDNVDMAAADKKGIKVLNTPDAPAKAVAELTMALIFSLMRHIPAQDRAIRAGGWERPMGKLLSEQTAGLIGYGRIGRRVADHLSGFGVKVLAHDPFAKDFSGAKKTDLDDLLKNADIISLHMPLTADNNQMVNADFLNKMKPGAVLINTARGELIDENALHDALKSGKLGGAALDVYHQEPYQGPLATLDNIILSAHTGSYAQETRMQQEAEAAQNLLDSLNTTETKEHAHG